MDKVIQVEFHAFRDYNLVKSGSGKGSNVIVDNLNGSSLVGKGIVNKECYSLIFLLKKGLFCFDSDIFSVIINFGDRREWISFPPLLLQEFVFMVFCFVINFNYISESGDICSEYGNGSKVNSSSF